MNEYKSYLILYMPGFHNGYVRLFERLDGNVSGVYLLGEEFVEEFTPLAREIRAVKPEVAMRVVKALGRFRHVRILNRNVLPYLRRQQLIVVKDQLTKRFAEKYLAGCDIRYETSFLRHDEASVFSKAPPKSIRVVRSRFHREMMALAQWTSRESSDWWRQVGAVLVKDGKPVAAACNRHVPSEHTPYLVGDPRDFIPAGQKSEISSVLHAEQGIVAETGCDVREGADLYVTVFPCPVCAKLVAFSGIKRVFFAGGHASLDGEAVMKARGVELLRVK